MNALAATEAEVAEMIATVDWEIEAYDGRKTLGPRQAVKLERLREKKASYQIVLNEVRRLRRKVAA